MKNIGNINPPENSSLNELENGGHRSRPQRKGVAGGTLSTNAVLAPESSTAPDRNAIEPTIMKKKKIEWTHSTINHVAGCYASQLSKPESARADRFQLQRRANPPRELTTRIVRASKK